MGNRIARHSDNFSGYYLDVGDSIRPDSYGDAIADVYDSWYDSALDSGSTISFLNSMPGDKVLELCCGTGRIAIPLARLGRSVTAVDISQKMLDELRRKSVGVPGLRARATLDPRHAVQLLPNSPSCGNQPAHISLTARRQRHAHHQHAATKPSRRRGRPPAAAHPAT